MVLDDTHASKRSRMGNGGGGDGRANAHSGTAAAARVGQEQRQDEDEEDGEGRSLLGRGGGGDVAGVRDARPWHQYSAASRIYRVSRATGGKDRHSKVMTAKGLRDRRVRLSVSTAIQFYDLQDRLGYDQPSKAIEWLIKAAAAAIADLPSLDGAFPDQPEPVRQPGDEEKPAGDAEEDEEDAVVSQLQYTNHHHLQHQQEEQQPQQRPQQRLSLTKSTCSSTSETSKGSVLSLSRSEIRVKARERARERTATAKDREKDKEDIEDDAHVPSAAHHQSMNPNPTSQSSFTELLTGGGHQNHTQHNHGPVTVAQANPAPNFIHKQLCQLPTSATAGTTTDYFGQVGLLGTGQKPHHPTIFPTQTHFGNSSPMGMVPFSVAAAPTTTTGDHPEMQQHYMQEHLIPFAVTAAAGDYINFSISSGFNRGTLQSNSPSPLLHHHLQMFSSPVDGSNLPFFLGAAAQAASASGEGQLPAGLDSRLQLCYRHPDLKGKGKN